MSAAARPPLDAQRPRSGTKGQRQDFEGQEDGVAPVEGVAFMTSVARPNETPSTAKTRNVLGHAAMHPPSHLHPHPDPLPLRDPQTRSYLLHIHLLDAHVGDALTLPSTLQEPQPCEIVAHHLALAAQSGLEVFAQIEKQRAERRGRSELRRVGAE